MATVLCPARAHPRWTLHIWAKMATVSKLHWAWGLDGSAPKASPGPRGPRTHRDHGSQDTLGPWAPRTPAKDPRSQIRSGPQGPRPPGPRTRWAPRASMTFDAQEPRTPGPQALGAPGPQEPQDPRTTGPRPAGLPEPKGGHSSQDTLDPLGFKDPRCQGHQEPMTPRAPSPQDPSPKPQDPRPPGPQDPRRPGARTPPNRRTLPLARAEALCQPASQPPRPAKQSPIRQNTGVDPGGAFGEIDGLGLIFFNSFKQCLNVAKRLNHK